MLLHPTPFHGYLSPYYLSKHVVRPALSMEPPNLLWSTHIIWSLHRTGTVMEFSPATHITSPLDLLKKLFYILGNWLFYVSIQSAFQHNAPIHFLSPSIGYQATISAPAFPYYIFSPDSLQSESANTSDQVPERKPLTLNNTCSQHLP